MIRTIFNTIDARTGTCQDKKTMPKHRLPSGALNADLLRPPIVGCPKMAMVVVYLRFFEALFSRRISVSRLAAWDLVANSSR